MAADQPSLANGSSTAVVIWTRLNTIASSEMRPCISRLKNRGHASCQNRATVRRPKHTDAVTRSRDTIPDPRATNHSVWSNLGLGYSLGGAIRRPLGAAAPAPRRRRQEPPEVTNEWWREVV